MLFANARRLVILGSLFSVLTTTALAQPDRIPGRIDPRRWVALQRNVHPRAQPQAAIGPADLSMKLAYVTLALKPSDSQQADLEQLLTDQQDPVSTNYHKWLTPEEFADRFGSSTSDIAKITEWLQSEGFAIVDVGRGRNWIAFSGNVQQVQTALHTEIRQYRVDGERHFANATAPSIPVDLEPLVIGFVGLDDFRPRPFQVETRARSLNAGQNPLYPEYTCLVVSPFCFTSGQHLLAPDDLATIYDLTPLYSTNITGSGQRIVVAGQTEIDLADVHSFRAAFGLPVNDPQLILVPGSANPGFTADLVEADLDLEWVGAVARNATICACPLG